MKQMPDQEPQPRPPETSLLHISKWQKLILSLLLVLATLALYDPVTRAPFLNLDDDLYITQNSNVRAGLTRQSVAWAFHTFANTNWHPLTWLSHELDCQLFGLNPAGPHMVNVLLHAACAALLFWMLASATGMTGRGLMVAALFALHPINVESVAWIAERKNVLSLLFFLLALAAYGSYARHRGIGRYLAVTVLYALALMAKPQVITFPFALLLLDYWPLRRIAAEEKHSGIDRFGKGASSAVPSGTQTEIRALAPEGIPRSFVSLVVEKLPWFALSAASALITMKAQSAARHEELPLWEHLANAALSYAKYIGNTFWPANLAPMYPHPGRTISIPAASLSALAILAFTIFVVIFRDRRYLFVGWFWFLGTMVPMIGIVQVGVQAMADRYAYIPLLGIFVIVCWGAADLLESWRVPAAVTLATSVIVLAATSFALHRQVNFWTGNFTLWRHTLDITERNFIAEDNAATALLAQGRTDDAIQYFRRANAIRPGDPVSALNIATYEQQHGNLPAAIDGYRKIFDLTADPGLLALAHVNRGYAYLALKQEDNAKQDFEAALQRQTENQSAYVGLGLIAQKAGDWDHAAQDFGHAINIQPTPFAYELLAQVLESSGRKEAAEAARAEAQRMNSALTHGAAAGDPSQAPHTASPSTP